MVAAVGHVEVLSRHRQADREAQRQHRFAATAQFDRLEVPRLRLGLLLEPGDVGVELAHRRVADQALAHVSFAIDQHHRRPGLDAVVLPQRPVRIVRDREFQLLPAQALRYAARIALVVETRHMHGHHMQAFAVAGAQHGEVVEPLQRPGRARVHESQRTDLAAQLRHAQRLGQVEPFECAGEFRCDDGFHRKTLSFGILEADAGIMRQSVDRPSRPAVAPPRCARRWRGRRDRRAPRPVRSRRRRRCRDRGWLVARPARPNPATGRCARWRRAVPRHGPSAGCRDRRTAASRNRDSRQRHSCRARRPEMSTPWRAAVAIARGSGGSPTCQLPVPTESTSTRRSSPAASTRLRSAPSAIGDRQMLPRQTINRRNGGAWRSWPCPLNRERP